MNHIHPTAIIYPNVTLGDNIYIGPYSVIGGPPEHKSKVDPREEPKFGVQIWDNTIIRSHVTIDAGVEHDTLIGSDCYIMSKAHIGHDCMIGMNCIIHSGAIIGGHSVVALDSRIGLGAVLHQRTHLLRGTMVGAQAFVKGIHETPYRILAGVPAKDIGPNQRLIDQLHGDKSNELPKVEPTRSVIFTESEFDWLRNFFDSDRSLVTLMDAYDFHYRDKVKATLNGK